MRTSFSQLHNYGQPIPQPTQLPQQLWISGQDFASSPQLLRKHDIRAVCSIGTDPFPLPQHIVRLQLEADDTLDQDISSHFGTFFEFVEKQRKQGNVLVHCVAGVSRSASLCCYYLMKKWGWGVEASLGCVRSVRPWVRPNDGFYMQLKRAEKEMGLGAMKARF